MRGDRSSLVRARFVGFTFLAAVTSLCVTASTSHAAEDYADLGWYAGLSGSLGVPVGEDLEGSGEGGGFALTGGYRLEEKIAIEGEFQWISGFEDSAGRGIDSPIMMNANLKGYAVTGRIQPWMLFGLGFMTLFDNTTPTEVTRFGFMLRIGAGLDYWVTPDIALTSGLDFVLPTGRIDKYQFFTFNLGATYRF